MNSEMSPSCLAAIIIPAHNEEFVFRKCLESITTSISFLENKELIEVVIVDNGSTDATVEVAKSFERIIPNIHIIREDMLGIGYARAAGARFALTRAANRSKEEVSTFWLITTDADVVVPNQWLLNWLREFSNPKMGLIAGRSRFDDRFYERYPVASSILDSVWQRVPKIESILGIINADGLNSAVERKYYAAIGPYTQPRRVTLDGTVANLAGEDWLLSTRAAWLGLPIASSSKVNVIASARRFESSPIDWLDGTAYEQPFTKVDTRTVQPDISGADFEKFYTIAAQRCAVHFVAKPILVNPTLLTKFEVIECIGTDLCQEISVWIASNKAPDIFQSGDEFVSKYLLYFHQKFGCKLTNAFFKII